MSEKTGIMGIYANPKKDPNGAAVKKIADVLNKYGIEYRVVQNASDNDGINMLIVLGGDGTILSVIRKMSDRKIPIFSVNIGTLGFLSEVELNEFEAAVPLIVEQKGYIHENLMIEAHCGSDIYTAVNEFCVLNEDRHEMVHVSVYINGDKAGSFDADGIIVSTPTGASAYSLSAGGPIVYPTANCLLITPICAHSITARPIVANADDVITIRSHKDDMILAYDWQNRVLLSKDTEIKIIKSKETAKFYKLNEHGFFDRMREKLIYNIRREDLN